MGRDEPPNDGLDGKINHMTLSSRHYGAYAYEVQHATSRSRKAAPNLLTLLDLWLRGNS